MDSRQDRQPEKYSSLMREDFQRILSQHQENCTFRIFILTKFHAPTTFACWKRKFKIEVCTCSQFLTEAKHWSKEVEMVESVDDLKFSRSVRGILGLSFEFLESFIQFTSFCSSCNLPDNSIIVFWSSMSFRLASVSKVELWNFRNSSISVRFC